MILPLIIFENKNLLILARKLVVFTAVAFVMQSCTHLPAYDSATPPVAISVANPQALYKFGKDSSTNPFMEPSSLLRGKFNEFYVIAIQLNLPKESRISIIAEMSANDGSVPASPYYREYLKEYWELYAERASTSDNVAAASKRNLIDNNVPASAIFKQAAGQTTLYLPFIGPNPIHRPANVYVQVSIDRGEPIIFEAELK